MKLAKRNYKVETRDDFEKTDYKIAEGGGRLIQEMLSSGVYKDPISSVIREYVSNCYDANVEAGKPDAPIEMNIKDDIFMGAEVVEFKDYGVGITPERFKKVFTKFLGSTKRDNNSEIGGFGIGSKVWWAYADTFYVNTCVNGVEYYYIATKDKDGCNARTIYEKPTDCDYNWTSIGAALKSGDAKKFKDRALTMFRFKTFTTNYDEVNEHLETLRNSLLFENEYLEMYKNTSAAFNKFRETYSKYYLRENIYAGLGNVVYDLEVKNPDEIKSCYTIILKFNIGELTPTISRESIRMDSEGKVEEILKSRLNDGLEHIKKEGEKEFIKLTKIPKEDFLKFSYFYEIKDFENCFEIFEKHNLKSYLIFYIESKTLTYPKVHFSKNSYVNKYNDVLTLAATYDKSLKDLKYLSKTIIAPKECFDLETSSNFAYHPREYVSYQDSDGTFVVLNHKGFRGAGQKISYFENYLKKKFCVDISDFTPIFNRKDKLSDEVIGNYEICSLFFEELHEMFNYNYRYYNLKELYTSDEFLESYKEYRKNNRTKKIVGKKTERIYDSDGFELYSQSNGERGSALIRLFTNNDPTYKQYVVYRYNSRKKYISIPGLEKCRRNVNFLESLVSYFAHSFIPCFSSVYIVDLPYVDMDLEYLKGLVTKNNKDNVHFINEEELFEEDFFTKYVLNLCGEKNLRDYYHMLRFFETYDSMKSMRIYNSHVIKPSKISTTYQIHHPNVEFNTLVDLLNKTSYNISCVDSEKIYHGYFNSIKYSLKASIMESKQIYYAKLFTSISLKEIEKIIQKYKHTEIPEYISDICIASQLDESEQASELYTFYLENK